MVKLYFFKKTCNILQNALCISYFFVYLCIRYTLRQPKILFTEDNNAQTISKRNFL